jgi:hypothetical protein
LVRSCFLIWTNSFNSVSTTAFLVLSRLSVFADKQTALIGLARSSGLTWPQQVARVFLYVDWRLIFPRNDTFLLVN